MPKIQVPLIPITIGHDSQTFFTVDPTEMSDNVCAFIPVFITACPFLVIMKTKQELFITNRFQIQI